MTPQHRTNPSSVKRKRLSLLPNNVNIGAPRLMMSAAKKRPSSIGLAPKLGVPGSALRRQSRLGPSSVRRSTAGYYPPSSSGRLFEEGRTSSTRNSVPGRPGAAVFGRVTNTPQRMYMGTQTRDPRPLRDRNYQAEMQKELLDWLIDNGFEIEMKSQLTARSLKSPTQKQCVQIFQFMYNKIDPGYKFVRSVEQDIHSILKFIEYPYLDNINKSQLSAVGSTTNWPTFLGMLHWLMQLVKQLQGFEDNVAIDSIEGGSSISKKAAVAGDDDGEVDEESTVFSRKVVDPNDSVIEKENTVLDRLFTNFALKSYKRFLASGSSDYGEFLDEMRREYDRCNEEIAEKMQSLESENVRIQSELKDKAAEYQELHAKTERNKALESDVSKFQRYLDLQRQRSKKWPVVLEKAKSDIESIKKSIAEADSEKEKIVAELQEKGFTLDQIEDMHTQRADLSKRYEEIEDQQNEINADIDERVQALQKQYTLLQKLVEAYNDKIDQIAELALEKEVSQLVVEPVGPLDDEHLGQAPSEAMPDVTQKDLVHNVSVLQDSVSKSLQINEEKALQMQAQVDDLKWKLHRLDDSLEEEKASVASFETDYNAVTQEKDSEVAELQADLEQITSEVKKQTSELDAAEKVTDKEYNDAQDNVKQLTVQLAEKRNALLIKLADEMGYVVSFKTGIMADLEGENAEIANEISTVK